MLIRNQKTMSIGLLLGVSFFGVLALIFSPVFGDGKNGLQYSDALFNKLAKGSSYFVPQLTASLADIETEQLRVKVKMDNEEQASKVMEIFSRAAPESCMKGAEVSIKANLAKLLEVVLQDSSAMYFNNGDVVRKKYGMDEKDVMTTWWAALNRCVKALQKSKNTKQANAILEVMKKGIEPAYNFYKIEARNVVEKALTAAALLVFYVLYTMWWGFAIFHLFDGLGLTMKKAGVKREL